MRKLFLLLLVALAAFALYEWLTFPDVAELRTNVPKSTAFMERRKAELARAGRDAEISYRWVPYERISPHLRRGVLVMEDTTFYEHKGVDVEQVKESLRRDWEKKQLAFGGSTITQQLAKNLYLSPSKNPYRKVKELIITRQLEKKLTKKRILELYLNVVEFGETVYGAEAAARHYFDRSARSLTPAQAALLAGCLPNPRVMNPADPNGRLRARQKIILSRMRRWGHLAEREVLTEKKKSAQPAAESEPEETEAVETIPESEPSTAGDTTLTTTSDTLAPEEDAAPVDPPATDQTTNEPPPEGTPDPPRR